MYELVEKIELICALLYSQHINLELREGEPQNENIWSVLFTCVSSILPHHLFVHHKAFSKFPEIRVGYTPVYGRKSIF